MFFNNILEELTDILIYYYSIVKNCRASNSAYSFLQYHLRKQIAMYQYHNDQILSINVSFNNYDDLNVDKLDNVSLYCIKQYIRTNIQDTSSLIRSYDDFSISLNVCPFEGLSFNGQFVISVCDCMMY